MKLKKYNEYVKEDLTPMSVDSDPLEVENDMTGEIEGERRAGQDGEFMDYDVDDASTLIGNNMNDDQEEEEEGNDLKWDGEELLQQFADKMKMEVIENQVKVSDNKVVTFASETNTFLITTDGKRRNTKISDPQQLYNVEFKGHEHNQ